jgi:hypothetical protein
MDSAPQWPISRPDRKKLRVKVATIAQKNVRQISAWFQKLAPSSIENSTPPIGAPNAAATPAPPS